MKQTFSIIALLLFLTPKLVLIPWHQGHHEDAACHDCPGNEISTVYACGTDNCADPEHHHHEQASDDCLLCQQDKRTHENQIDTAEILLPVLLFRPVTLATLVTDTTRFGYSQSRAPPH